MIHLDSSKKWWSIGIVEEELIAPNQVIGPFVLGHLLGKGGMGQVWRALDTRLARPVALKILDSPSHDAGDDGDANRRFRREAQAASALNHPNVLTVFESGEWEGLQYLVTELIEGQTLREIVRTGGPPPLGQSLELIAQILRGLEAAHGAGIVHRDITPDNLIVRRDGLLKILDFGLARTLDPPRELRVTGEYVVVGTPGYMAPEVLAGAPSPQSDLFSVGCVGFYLLTGREAFPGDDVKQVLLAVLTRDPGPTPDLEEPLSQWLRTAMHKDPAQRFLSALAMRQALPGILPVQVLPPRQPGLVVLPLAALAKDRELAAGLTDELIARLARLEGLRVIAGSSSFRYAESTKNLKEIAAELNVCLALEGRLRRSGTQLRVTTSLVQAREGVHIWGGQFDGDLRNVFAMEDEWSEAVVQAVRGLVGTSPPGADSTGSVVRPRNTTANELYLKATHFLGTYEPMLLLAALEALGQVVVLEPNFASGHARLSQAYLTLLLLEQHVDGAWDRACRSAARALELDPDDPDGLVTAAMVERNNPCGTDWNQSRRYLRQALRHTPGHADALSYLALVNINLGNAAAGEMLARRALAADPLVALHYARLTYALISLGRFFEAAEATHRCLHLFPENQLSCILALWLDLALQRQEEAGRYLEHLEKHNLGGPLKWVIRQLYLAYRGQLDPSLLESATVPPMRAMRLEWRRLMADTLSLSGRPEQAVGQLEAAFAEGYRNLDLLENDPFLTSCHGLPCWQGVLSSMGAAIADDAGYAEPFA